MVCPLLPLFFGHLGNIRPVDQGIAFAFDDLGHIVTEGTGRPVIVVGYDARREMDSHSFLGITVFLQLSAQVFHLGRQASIR